MGISNIRMDMTGICEGGAYTTVMFVLNTGTNVAIMFILNTGTNVAIMCASKGRTAI